MSIDLTRCEELPATALTCTRLYSVEPAGLYTPHMECLTGYRSRLAEAHCVSTLALIASEISPLLKKPGAFNSRGPFHIFHKSVNGTGKTAADLVTVLSTLTGRVDLFYDVCSLEECSHTSITNPPV